MNPHDRTQEDQHSDAELNAMTLGRTIYTLANFINNDTARDNKIDPNEIESLLQHAIADIEKTDDNNLRAFTTGLVQAIEIAHRIGRYKHTPRTHPAPDHRTTTHPIACGHHHNIHHYGLGCTYTTHLTLALDAAHHHAHDTALHHTTIANNTLGPLAQIADPNTLRDFIAGIASAADNHLRSLGTPIPN